MRVVGVILVMALGGACATTGNGRVSSTTHNVENSAELDVAALASFVEARRERSFDPTLQLRDTDGYQLELFDDGVPIVELVSRKEIAALMPPEPTTASDWTLLRLLDVVPDDANREVVNRQLNLAVTGRCCPIVVVDADNDTIEAAAAVHELTHQIEFLDASFPPGDQTLEWSLYAMAASEGNAERIRGDYLDSIGVAPERWTELNPPAVGVPDKLSDLFDFPYTYGADFMRAVDDRGGESAIDATLATPPVSSKQVMFPDAYFANDAPVAVERAQPTARPIADRTGTLGAFLLYLAIRDSSGEDTAERIVSEWHGDSYVVSTSTDQVCLDLKVLMSTPSNAAALADALTTAPSASDVTFQVSADDDTVDAVRCLDALD